MILLVTGGRRRRDLMFIYKTLDRIHVNTPITCLIEGGALGADEIARRWCLARNVHNATVPALWRHHGNAAGPIRNAAMLTLKPGFVAAFPSTNSVGTRDLIAKAKKLAVPFVVYKEEE